MNIILRRYKYKGDALTIVKTGKWQYSIIYTSDRGYKQWTHAEIRMREVISAIWTWKHNIADGSFSIGWFEY